MSEVYRAQNSRLGDGAIKVSASQRGERFEVNHAVRDVESLTPLPTGGRDMKGEAPDREVVARSRTPPVFRINATTTRLRPERL